MLDASSSAVDEPAVERKATLRAAGEGRRTSSRRLGDASSIAIGTAPSRRPPPAVSRRILL
jgi:hypothetical protein